MPGTDLSGTTPNQLVVWLAAQCHDGMPETIMAGDLGPMGEMTLDELARLAFDAEGAGGPGPDLGTMGKVTLDELRAIAQDVRTIGQILSS